MDPSHNQNTYQNSPTPPIYGQPPPPHSRPAPPYSQSAAATWSTGLCSNGCCSDFSNCCVTFWCPFITFGRIAEIVDKGSTSCVTGGALYALITLTQFEFIYSGYYRSKLRGQYMLPESPWNDYCVHFCCKRCALSQEYRELKNRGLDPSLGWQGTVHRQNLGVAMAPMMQPGMRR